MDGRPASKEIWTIPNILSMLRLVLAGVFAVVFWRAKEPEDYYVAVAVLAVSGLTDFADGKIARRFGMVSELGKVLDPIADKLTQAVVAVCLCRDYPAMGVLLGVLVVKEVWQGLYGLYVVRRTGAHYSSMWCGKISTFYLYGMMVLLILVPTLPLWLSGGLIAIGVGLLVWSFSRYWKEFHRLVRESE